MSTPTFPVDYDEIRKTLVSTVTAVTKIPCIMDEPEIQNAPRPANPYFSFKITNPGGKNGDDTLQQIGSAGVLNIGGQRKMTVSFKSYGKTHEEAYKYMALWQASLEAPTVQQVLRAKGIAVWLNGSVVDLSQLLNTGYEGRAQLDVQFGIVSNLTDNPGYIEEVGVSGTVKSGTGSSTTAFNVPESEE